MDTHKLLIADLNRKINLNQSEIEIQVKKLGEYLPSLNPEAFEKSSCADAYKKAQELKKQLPLNTQQVRKIIQSVEQNAEIETLLKKANEKILNLEKENNAIYEKIGQAAYDAFKSAPQQEADYGDMFAELIKQEKDLRGFEEQYRRFKNSQKGGNLLKNISDKGRSAYFKGTLSLKNKALERSYHRAGKRFCDSELVEKVEDSALLQVLVPYRESRKKIQGIERETQTLRKKQEALWSELKVLGAEKSHQKRVKEIEKKINQNELLLEESYETLGKLYLDKPIKSLSEDKEIKKYLNRIAQYKKNDEKNKKQIKRVEAAIRVDAIAGEIEVIRDRIAKLEKEIKTNQEEIVSLGDQIARTEQEKEKLIKVRGPEQTLPDNSGPT